MENKRKKPKIIGLIPARYASTRFPGKPLIDILGKPMIWWTYNQAKKSKLLDEVFVAAHDKKIADACDKLGIPNILTEAPRFTGTDNISVAAKKVPGDLYINIQGDEPTIDPKIIDAIIRPMIADPSIQVLNLMSEIVEMYELVSSTIPKVVVDRENYAMFYSRSPIPFPKSPHTKYFKQIGMYGFRPEALRKFSELPQGFLEKSEEIELLRFLENRIPVKMVTVKSKNIAVDTPADLELVLKIMESRLKKTGRHHV